MDHRTNVWCIGEACQHQMTRKVSSQLSLWQWVVLTFDRFDLLPSVKDVKVLGVDLQDDIIFSTNEEVLALDLEDAAKGAEALLSLKSSATRSTISKFVPLDAHDAMVIDCK